MKLRIAVSMLAASCLIAFASCTVMALIIQNPSPVRSAAVYTERDRQFRELDQQRQKSVEKKDAQNQAAMSQLREDFSRLYELQQSQLLPALKAVSLEYQAITRTSEEIKSRASRIRQNLLAMLSERDGKRKKEYSVNESDLHPAFTELSALIVRFVNSPVFQVNSANDNELRLAAREDLEGIIKLSEGITKAAKKMMKSANQ